jgi:hypothetical protein
LNELCSSDVISNSAEWEHSIFGFFIEPSASDVDGGAAGNESTIGLDLLDEWISKEIEFKV